jgi:hypothetical protein
MRNDVQITANYSPRIAISSTNTFNGFTNKTLVTLQQQVKTITITTQLQSVENSEGETINHGGAAECSISCNQGIDDGL